MRQFGGRWKEGGLVKCYDCKEEASSFRVVEDEDGYEKTVYRCRDCDEVFMKDTEEDTKEDTIPEKSESPMWQAFKMFAMVVAVAMLVGLIVCGLEFIKLVLGW